MTPHPGLTTLAPSLASSFEPRSRDAETTLQQADNADAPPRGPAAVFARLGSNRRGYAPAWRAAQCSAETSTNDNGSRSARYFPNSYSGASATGDHVSLIVGPMSHLSAPSESIDDSNHCFATKRGCPGSHCRRLRKSALYSIQFGPDSTGPRSACLSLSHKSPFRCVLFLFLKLRIFEASDVC